MVNMLYYACDVMVSFSVFSVFLFSCSDRTRIGVHRVNRDTLTQITKRYFMTTCIHGLILHMEDPGPYTQHHKATSPMFSVLRNYPLSTNLGVKTLIFG